jgi:hypothetical protein
MMQKNYRYFWNGYRHCHKNIFCKSGRNRQHTLHYWGRC